MKPPVKIMFLIDSMSFGGAEVLLRDLTNGLLLRGYHVSVCYSTPGPIVEDFSAMGINAVRLPRLGRFDPALTWRMWREIKREKPTIVHTHLFKSDFHGRFAARLAGVPVVLSTLHNCEQWAQNPVFGRLYGLTSRLADKMIAVSQEVCDYAVKFHLSNAKSLVTIPNAIPIDKFKKNEETRHEIRREFNISPSAPLLGIIARLSEQKDHANFLRSAAYISAKRPDARFLIVGDGPLRESLQKLTQSLALEDKVIFCGVRKDIPAIYSALDLLVFSSRWEGLPVSLLEGMAAGLAIVSTNVGGVGGVLQEGITGRLVSPENPDSLAEACLQLIADPEHRNKMGMAGLAVVQAKYSMEAMVASTSSLYESLLQRST